MRLASMYEIEVPEVDVAVILPHPGQAELFCGGTILKWVAAGKRVAVLDLTAGEAGSWGRHDAKLDEAEAASKLLGLSWRGCARFPDGRVEDTVMSRMTITGEIKRLRAATVVGLHERHPHPDARASSQLVENSSFLAKLARLDDYLQPLQVKDLWFAQGAAEGEPSIVVDITNEFPRKLEILSIYSTLGPDLAERATESARRWGATVGVRYGEAFSRRGPVLLQIP
jgi:N-acetylglucosamine malate deacetylase 1